MTSILLLLGLIAQSGGATPAPSGSPTLDSGVPTSARSPAATHAARPIRTNTPGTGVFIGSGLLGQTILERRSRGEETLWEWSAVIDFRYTPATHWVFGVRAPWIRRSLERSGFGEESASGLGDVSFSVKHRFHRSVGAWSDRHAAVELVVELPTGSDEEPLDAALPLQRRVTLQPGTGSTDLVLDLVYQEGRRRFVYGGDLSYRRNGEGDGGYRFGDEIRLNTDVEYILFPREYVRPGDEVFVLLETTLLHRGADEVDGAEVPGTERTELLVAPALQHVATERLLLSLSLQVPVVADVDPPGLERDFDVLAEFRYAF